MSTEKIKQMFQLGKGWKRVSKAKLGSIELRLFASKEDDDTRLFCQNGDEIRELDYCFARTFQYNLLRHIQDNKDSIPLELVKNYLANNSQEFILASLSQLRHLEYPGELKQAIKDLTKMSQFDGVDIQDDDGCFDIFLEDCGESLGDCCFRLNFSIDNVELITD